MDKNSLPVRAKGLILKRGSHRAEGAVVNAAVLNTVLNQGKSYLKGYPEQIRYLTTKSDIMLPILSEIRYNMKCEGEIRY